MEQRAKHKLSDFILFRILATACLLGCSGAQAGVACSDKAQGSVSYEKAAAEIEKLPEYRNWQKYVTAHQGRHPTRVPLADKQMRVGNHCYWSITAYSDEGTHMHLWNTFYVRTDRTEVLILDMEGEPIPLRKWRSSELGRTWRTVPATPDKASPGTT